VLVFAHAGSVAKLFRFPRVAALRGLDWRLFIDTGRSPPLDIHALDAGPRVDVEKPIELVDRSLVCLVADADPLPGRRRIAGPAG
jgi:hypothetical protein